MGNDRVEEFLDLYKKLEQLLKQRYANDSGHYESVIARYENSRDCGNMKDELMATQTENEVDWALILSGLHTMDR